MLTKVSAMLTPREIEVLAVMAEGAGNAEISERLCISPKTTNKHVSSILYKLDAKNRTHAVVRAVEAGLVIVGNGGCR